MASNLPRNPDGSIKAGPGRRAGVPNKTTADLAAMIDQALADAGGAAYLLERAKDPATMGAFLSLVGKRLPKDMKLDLSASHASTTEAASQVPRVIVDLMLALERMPADARGAAEARIAEAMKNQ